MPFSTDDLETLRRDLTQLPPNRPKSVNNRDAVAALTPELVAAQRRGYSVEDLAQLLSEKGLRMTAGTLKGYLQRARKNKRPRRNAPNGNGAMEAMAPAAPNGGASVVAAKPASEPPSAQVPAPAVVPVAHGVEAGRPTDAAIGKGAGSAASAAAGTGRRPAG